MDVQRIARQTAKRYGTTDPFLIAKEKNVKVLYEPLGTVLGYHSYAYRFHFIHLNQSMDEYWQRFICAHELGHLFLHPQMNTAFLLRSTLFSVDRIERQANIFAVELLSADACEYTSIDELCTKCGLPKEFTVLKKFYT